MMQPPKIGIDQFWQLLRASELVPAADLNRLTEKSATLKHKDPQAVADWLVDQKVITPLHSEVLQAGHQGPFEFGRYRILARAPGDKTWEARDLKTSHPVWLHFFAGQSSKDFATWDKIEQQAEQFQSIQHPNLLRVYECVTTRQYRFVATSDGDSKSLAEKMPLKSRLSEEQGLALIRPIASAMAKIEQNNLAHGDLCLDHVFHKAKAGITKILPPVLRVNSDQKASDINSLGRLLYRVLSGRDAAEQQELVDVDFETLTEPLSSRKIGTEVCQIVFDSLTDNSLTASDFLQRVEKASKESFEETSSKPSAVEAKFLASLSPWDVEAEQLPIDAAIPDVEEEASDSLNPEQVQKKGKRSIPVTLGLYLVGFAALVGVSAMLANLAPVKQPETVVADADKPNTEVETPGESGSTTEPPLTIDPLPEALLATEPLTPPPASGPSYVQEFVADDQQTLWESPTTGFPVDTSFVPAAPRIIASINWNSIYQSPYGQRTIQSLGPSMERQRQELESRTGFALTDIKSTIISFHSNLSLEYETCVVVTLQNPVSRDTCLNAWKQPTPVPDSEDVFEKKPGTSWWIAETGTAGEVVSFVVGPSALVQQAAKGDVAWLSGTFRNLVDNSDADRDVNLMFPTISLFNTEGQKLFAQNQKWANELRVTLPQPVRGLLISLHSDAGNYIEFHVDHTGAISGSEAAEAMQEFTQKQLEQISQAVDQRQALPFWEPIRARFSAMLRELSKQLRWNTEFDSVVGNAWLPPGALHNLFAASELAMAFEPQKIDVAAAKKPKIPQTLEELLATRRTLTIANPPDLNVLLKNIQEEVSDQYLEMPFEFNIQINGTDLQKDGITQNQRPGPLRINDQSLSEILTQVMVSANPNRDISGAADPNCKLVWVIDKDPDGKSIVLITTRTAATQKGLELPAAFVPQP